jgi:transposase InsO family protein
MGSKGDCYDNSVPESFFATLKKELVHRSSWPTRRELASELFDYIEAFYNRPAPTLVRARPRTLVERVGRAGLCNGGDRRGG